MNKVPIYNIAIEEDEFDLGLTKMSLVEYPAVNVPFLKFSENDIVKETFSTNKDKKIVTSVALLADTPIKRIDDYGNSYYVVLPIIIVICLFGIYRLNKKEKLF